MCNNDYNQGNEVGRVDDLITGVHPEIRYEKGKRAQVNECSEYLGKNSEIILVKSLLLGRSEHGVHDKAEGNEQRVLCE